MIERLLPEGVVAVEAFGDIPGERPFPGEEDLIAKAVEVRRREFVTARRCAREALARLGHPPAPIRPGPGRDPQWPTGVIGSITHCRGFRAAAVAPRTILTGMGIDAEPHEPLPEGVQESVTAPGESEMLTALTAASPGVHWDRLLFSAKESVYKVWYPLTGRWLGFEEARLSIDPTAGTFSVRLLVDGARRDSGPPLIRLAGRFLVARGLVVTAVVL
ncbi:4'-phosphopantetheinyl transferase superfamily protein [Micromonospora arborensis]|uniref:4'-phosphopantetheinyl transferase family protein n=1 Tax=Micromonospora arborensis TaxID=2116518 RepID=UPI003420A79F